MQLEIFKELVDTFPNENLKFNILGSCRNSEDI